MQPGPSKIEPAYISKDDGARRCEEVRLLSHRIEAIRIVDDGDLAGRADAGVVIYSGDIVIAWELGKFRKGWEADRYDDDNGKNGQEAMGT